MDNNQTPIAPETQQPETPPVQNTPTEQQSHGTSSVPPSTPTQNPKSRNWKKWLIIGGITLVILLTGTAYVLSQQKESKNQQTAIKPTPTPASDAAGADPTTNWKTFTYQSLSLKLPSEWNEYLNTPTFIQLANYDITTAPGRGFDQNQDKGKLKIEVSSVQTNQSLETYIAQLKKQAETDFAGGTVTWNESQLIIGGRTATKVKSNFPGFTVYSKDISDENILIISFALDFDKYPELANQILSTFKFTKPTSPSSSLSCTPRPACLDADPPCLMPEPTGMCPKTPIACPAAPVCKGDEQLVLDTTRSDSNPQCPFYKCMKSN
jgi:hypothetical protein